VPVVRPTPLSAAAAKVLAKVPIRRNAIARVQRRALQLVIERIDLEVCIYTSVN
jgi:hypothetical protein